MAYAFKSSIHKDAAFLLILTNSVNGDRMGLDAVQRKYRTCIHVLLRIVVLCAISLSATAHAAGLGKITVSSALGEPFQALIKVSTAENEVLSTLCFRIGNAITQEGGHALRRARLDYTATPSGGELAVIGVEIVREPLLTLEVQLQCPNSNTQMISREYNILLDPRDYTVFSNQSKSRLPSVEPVSAALNPVLPTLKPAMESSLTPVPRALPSPVDLLAASPTRGPAPKKTHKSIKKVIATPAPNPFRLQLSIAPLDAERAQLDLSEEEKLNLRERLLLIESDDQTAQLLQLKDRIARMEKQLSQLQQLTQPQQQASAPTLALAAKTVPAQTTQNGWNSWWLWLFGFVMFAVLATLFFWWRTRIKPSTTDLFEQEDFWSGAEDGDKPHFEKEEVLQAAVKVVSPSVESVNTVKTTATETWGSEHMDVVSPGNVSEEAQLLLEHGLTRQAIDLLLQEIAHRPTYVAWWMQLFEAYRIAGDKRGLQQQAQAFREHVSSESLWRQVQLIGRELDPSNALYFAEAAQSLKELAVEGAEAPSGNDDFDLQFMAAVPETEQMQDKPVSQYQDIDLSLEFHMPEITLPKAEGEWPSAPSATEKDFDVLMDFERPSLEPIPSDELINSTDPLLDATFFETTDPALQALAELIKANQLEAALTGLEKLLYSGGFDQRVLAARWLDRLTPERINKHTR